MNDLDRAALRRILKVSETNSATDEHAVYLIVLGSLMSSIAPGLGEDLFYNLLKDATPLVWIEEETFRAGKLDKISDGSIDPVSILMDKYIGDDTEIPFLYAVVDCLCFALQGVSRLSGSLEEMRETVNGLTLSRDPTAKEI